LCCKTNDKKKKDVTSFPDLWFSKEEAKSKQEADHVQQIKGINLQNYLRGTWIVENKRISLHRVCQLK